MAAIVVAAGLGVGGAACRNMGRASAAHTTRAVAAARPGTGRGPAPVAADATGCKPGGWLDSWLRDFSTASLGATPLAAHKKDMHRRGLLFLAFFCLPRQAHSSATPSAELCLFYLLLRKFIC